MCKTSIYMEATLEHAAARERGADVLEHFDRVMGGPVNGDLFTSGSRPRLIVFALSGGALDAATLGAHLAGWADSEVTVVDWPAHGPPDTTAPDKALPMPAPDGLRVVLASRRPAVFLAAHEQLAGTSSVRSLALATDASQLRERIAAEGAPHLLLLDEELMQTLDEATTGLFSQRADDLHVLLLCERMHRGHADSVIARGLHGCLEIVAAPGTWAKAVSAVRRGELWLPRAMLPAAVLQQAAAQRTGASPPLPDGLTRRERETVSLVREGLSNKQIARRLGVGEDTVKKHLQHAFAKLGIHRRALVVVGGTAARDT